MEKFNYSIEEEPDGFYAVVQINNKYLSTYQATQKEGPYSTQERAERTLEEMREIVDSVKLELDSIFSVESKE